MQGFFSRITAFLTALVVAAVMLSAFAGHFRAAAAAVEIPGIDVSKYQDKIDWNAVAQTDVRFAIIRCCKIIRAYNDWEFDSTFEENYAAAKANGLAVGAYLFTDAATIDEFQDDVEYMLGFLKDKSFELPVFLDLESASRQEHLPPSEFMPAVLAGLEMIEDAGHTAGVYSSTAFFHECLDRKQLQDAGYCVWEANYFNTVNGLLSPAGHDLSNEATIWQYSGCGRCEGINTTVDRNICYTYQYFNHTAELANPTLPSGSLRPGSNFTVGGTVRADNVIRTITGAIYDMKNPAEPVQTVTVYPHAKDYKLTGFFTKKLVFSTLEEGTYNLRISAIDSADTEIEVADTQFIVSTEDRPVTAAQQTQQQTAEVTDPAAVGTADAAVPAASQPAVTQPPAAQKQSKSLLRLRYAAWLSEHWSLRKTARTAVRIGLKLDLVRTPLYRFFFGCSTTLESAYIAATLMLDACRAADQAA